MKSPHNYIYPEIMISIIIPAHNAEKTLKRAVESAVDAMSEIGKNETLLARRKGSAGRDSIFYEILIIENGSEDGTEFNAMSLHTRYPDTVRVLRSEKGVSNARNKGLDEAKGDWILFLDADDYFTGGASSVLRDDMFFSGTDLIVHSYESGENLIHLCPPAGERFSGDITEICVRMIENPTRYTAVWSKLFKRERIEHGNLRFDPSLRLSEDSHFFIRYLSLCRRIRIIDRVVYHYSTDNDSAVRTWDGKKEEGYRKSLLAVQSFLNTQPKPIREAFAGYGMMQFNLLMVREIFSAATGVSGGAAAQEKDSTTIPFPRHSLTLAERIRRMQDISREEPFATAIRGFDPKHHRGARYLPIFLLRSGMAAGAAAIYEARVIQNMGRERMH